MADDKGFSHALASEEKQTEKTLAFAVSWYLCKSTGLQVTISDVCEFIDTQGIRVGITKNCARVGKSLKSVSGASVDSKGKIRLTLTAQNYLHEKYSQFLGDESIEIEDKVLHRDDFSSQSNYIQSLVRQINACHQIHAFDGCAVMMRRLIEALIIIAFNRSGLHTEIVDKKGDYISLEELISALNRCTTLKLSRGAPATLSKVKKRGDRAAHSSNYITPQKDIDEIGADFRALIVDLLNLNHPSSTH